MSARVFILLFMLLEIVYSSVMRFLAESHRKKPLPEEVADIYDKERYETYLSYTADRKKAGIVFSIIELFINCIMLFSGIYSFVENKADYNPVLIVIITFLIFYIIDLIISAIKNYYYTFSIEDKYGLNKKDIKEFIKDMVIEEVFGLVLSMALLLILTFLGEHMASWTNNFSVGMAKSLIICLLIAAAVGVFVSVTMLLSYFALKKQYVFTPLEKGELLDKINKLQESSKKKVKSIYVYNESKKSTSKNAFLLKLFFHREFGIADNFMNENAEDELLAVLSHEIGHLKHKKNILNYIKYIAPVALFFIIWDLIYSPAAVLNINGWIRQSFGISVNNYYILMLVYMYIIKPIAFVIGTFSAYVSRIEEHEADMEAVNNGYGEALITTFKQLSSDELVNVYPHPLIEFFEYDHPGMYQRIKAIKDNSSKS